MSDLSSRKVDLCDDDDRNSDIKSRAVVKYSAALVPAPYIMLQLNTNLNLPPSNWLSNSVAVYGVPPRILTRSGFSSFAMAHKFPDCIGEVDVVSDAENIKKLLKMPISSSPLSLLIHRVENTLLIDEFDISKLYLASEGRWGWFRQFFEKLMQSMQLKPEKVIDYKSMSRNNMQQKSLVSKFLYHSLVPSPDLVAQSESDTKEEAATADPNTPIPLPFTNSEPPLPEPRLEQELPDPAFSHNFARNVIWNFEDIQMLLGTDIPIFGGGTHPCISLRLRDMTKPINVLTGMDYWLDNLMCNVPEVVMCYHLNGIVQRYELIKTEDLPDLPNSKFSPKVIRDVAQNILSFLKANATKSGHTYWLFKGRGDDVVKLYDLTSLCTDVLEEGQTPFTVPVAMLLYRVARNMKHQNGRLQAATICKLLKNCVSLLPSQKYPEIETSAHYMLADVYVPSDLNPNHPDLTESSEEVNNHEDTDPVEDEYMAIRSLSLSSIREPQDEPFQTSLPQAAPLTSDVITRCKEALQHVVNGVQCLTYIDPEEPKMASKSESIPMGYERVSQGVEKVNQNNDNIFRSVRESPSSAMLPKTSGEAVKSDSWSWDIHLKTLLYNKAALIYLTLIENAFKHEKFGEALSHCKMATDVFNVLVRLRGNRPSTSSWMEFSVFSRAGDALVMLVTKASSKLVVHNEDYLQHVKLDADLKKLMLYEVGENKEQLLPPFLDGPEALLLASVACYSCATSQASDEDQRSSIQRRIGNVENEIGVFYMNRALSKLQNTNDINEVKESVEMSQSHLQAGIAAFQKVEDSTNLALLYSNSGKLMRLRAHIHASSEANRSDLAQQERIFYRKAILNYERALDILGERATNPAVWDPVYWELSTTYFTMASLLQDYPAPSKNEEDAEREVTELLHKALKYCDFETSGTKRAIYEFRAAKVHHRLASLHHHQFRGANDEARRKHALQLCRLHYDKAARLLLALKHPTQYLTVQMERIGLSEALVECTGRIIVKNKHLMQAVDHMVECCPIFDVLCDSDATYDPDEVAEQLKILQLMLKRLQFILLSLIKNSTKKTTEDKSSAVTTIFKKWYSSALRTVSSTSDVKLLARGLNEVLLTISNEIDHVNKR